MAALVDTNVVLDLLAQREPWYASASDLIFLCAQGKCQLALSGSTVTDLYYLIHKYTNNTATTSKDIIARLLDIFSVVEVGFSECCLALTSRIDDYEDAVLAEAAVNAKLDCIVSRNGKDFTHAGIPVLSPEEYLQKLAHPSLPG